VRFGWQSRTRCRSNRRAARSFRLVTPEKKVVLMDNIAAAMAGVPEHRPAPGRALLEG